MGCDIHAIWQAKKDGKWVDIESTWKQDRHYFLFSWLADVRNGFGFAGIPTYAPVKPIAQPRGLPNDFECDDDRHYCSVEAIDPSRREWLEEGEKPNVWMGDHSHSYLSADEILSAQRPDGAWATGIVTRKFFENWDGKTTPESWSGGISGPDIHVAESPVEVDDKTTHVRIFFKRGSGELDYFVDEVKRLKELHEEVRIVFGFDS